MAISTLPLDGCSYSRFCQDVEILISLADEPVTFAFLVRTAILSRNVCVRVVRIPFEGPLVPHGFEEDVGCLAALHDVCMDRSLASPSKLLGRHVR